MKNRELSIQMDTMIKASIASQTKRWYDTREKMITGTDLSTIIGVNAHDDINSLYNRKINNIRSIDNTNTMHGKKFEDCAIKILEKMRNIKINEIGFKVHPEKKYLGATPDGITIEDEQLKLIEIKCPTNRNINGLLPFYYYSQIQLQLYVCQLDECLYFECDFEEITKEQYDNETEYEKGYITEHNVYWRLKNRNLIIVNYDPLFMKFYENDIYNFYKRMTNTLTNKNTKKRKRENDTNIELQYIYSKNYKKEIKDFIYTNNYYTDYLNNNKSDTWFRIHGEKHFVPDENTEFAKKIIRKQI